MAGPTALHLLLVHLRPGVTQTQRDALARGFESLRSIDGVIHMGQVEGTESVSTHHLGLFAYLRDAAALERFGTHSLLMKYLQRSFLPVVEDFMSMDIAVRERPPDRYGAALCFCVDFPSDTYDRQVRSALAQVTESLGEDGILGNATGVALNQRQPFRAGGIVFAASPLDLSRATLHAASTDATAPSRIVAVAGPAYPLA
jgi:hypothetical protein